MIALIFLIGSALAQCSVEVPALAAGEQWSGVVAVEDRSANCRVVELGRVTAHQIVSLKGVIRRWDDGRTRFGEERLVRSGEDWRVELPEWREGDRLKMKLGIEASEVGTLWVQPRETLQKPDRVELMWSSEGPPVFGVDGNVSLKTTHVWSRLEGPGVFTAIGPDGSSIKECSTGTTVTLDVQSYGCVLRLASGEVASLSLVWVEEGVGLSGEWILKDGQSLLLEGAAVESTMDVSGEGVVEGPGAVVVHLTQINGAPVEAVALEEVELAARLVSIPEPGLGLRFKGRQVDDALIQDILGLVREQVQNGRLSGGHPLKARPLMEVRRSGWATPWEQALLLSRYLGQMKLNATALPVRPVARGRAVSGAPEGYTHAVVEVETGGEHFWLDPSCRACEAGEITPGLWGGQVFSTVRERMPDAPQSRR